MNNIAKIRGRHQLSQSALAEKIGVTKQGLCFNEKGKCSITMALQVAEALHENVFEILGTDALVMEPLTEEDKEILINAIINCGVKKEFTTSLGKKLRSLRKEKGLTLEELKELSGISITSLGFFENGSRTPTVQHLHKIAKALGYNYDELYELAIKDRG